ncbi:class I SAM-dependent methyltransferase [Actinomadura rugatobispora]|uniref:S-adenosyl-L-methionine-dependent methyltransferase n=1 Tax=Actinomadura rugatobispora TaxID=1994 RepID=A0ABW0ZN11_9ACTN|nr:SAM-dependent methyltransferase [Actinomadura rugatobispora]
MENGRLSQTAVSAAAARAAHLLVDGEPHIFRDTLAATLLDGLADEMIGYHRTHGDHIILAGTRAITTARGRYTEDRVARLGSPARYVILGAGLDTFAYRTPREAGVQVVEIDHPATQKGKLALLESAGIPVPENVTFVPADFESAPFTGLSPSPLPTLVSWLGVSVYLTREAIEATLAAVAALGPGTQFIMEYMLPAGLRDSTGNSYADIATQAVSDRGEPYATFLTPEEVADLLTGQGFEVLEQTSMREAVPAALWTRDDALRPFAFTHLVHATTTPSSRSRTGRR